MFFSSYLVIFPATLQPFCQSVSHTHYIYIYTHKNGRNNQTSMLKLCPNFRPMVFFRGCFTCSLSLYIYIAVPRSSPCVLNTFVTSLTHNDRRVLDCCPFRLTATPRSVTNFLEQWGAGTIDVTHRTLRHTTTETRVAYDNSTWHAINTRYIHSTKETPVC